MTKITFVELGPSGITLRYQWLIDRFIKEFGKEHVIYHEYDLGHGFGIGVKNGEFRHAAAVEGYVFKLVRFRRRYRHFSLNNQPAAEKERQVKVLIQEIKEKVRW